MHEVRAEQPWWNGGLWRRYWRLTHGDRGWELAGKGAAAWIAGSVLSAISGASDDLHLWNPFHVLSAVLVIGGVGALVAGLVREGRRARQRLDALLSPAPAASEPAGTEAEVAQTARDAQSLPLQDAKVSALDPELSFADAEAEAVPVDDDVEAEAIRVGVVVPAPKDSLGATPTAKAPSALKRAQSRGRQGDAGENYVAKILKDLPRSKYLVTTGLLLPAADLGRHVGNLDVLVERVGQGLAAVIEVKTTHPATRVDGVPIGVAHRQQAARLAYAVSELDDLSVFAFVAYVDPVGSARDQLKRMEPRYDDVDGLTIASTGAWHLKAMLLDTLNQD